MRGTLSFSLLGLVLALVGCGGTAGSGDAGSTPPDAWLGADASSLPGSDAGPADDAASAPRDDAAVGADAWAPRVDTTVTIALVHHVAGAPVTISSDTPYVNAAGNHFGVTRVSWFLSDVVLTTTDGRTFEARGAHYVDADTADTQRIAIPLGTESGELASISFHMGLPPELNVTGAFAEPPESLMEWPAMMGGGYHYMKFEGRYVNAAGEPFAFRAHSGALRGTDYSFPVRLGASGVTIGEGDVTLTIAMNLEDWFTSPDTWDLNDYFTAAMPGIMGNAAAQASLQRNGEGVFTLEAP